MVFNPFSPAGPAMEPTSEAQPPSLVDQWKATLSDPKIQAALMAAGTALASPRWNNQSAFPDALNAAGTAVAAQQGYEDKQAQEVEQNRQVQANLDARLSEGAADRQNRLATAKIGADARTEIANAQMAARYDRMLLASQAKTPAELRLEAQAIQAHKNYKKEIWKGQPGNLTKTPSKEEETAWEEEAKQIAGERILGLRLKYGLQVPGVLPAGGNANQINTPDTTRQNAPISSPGRGSTGSTQTPENTSLNKLTVDQLKSNFSPDTWEHLLQDPDARKRLELVLTPGEKLPPGKSVIESGSKLGSRKQTQGTKAEEIRAMPGARTFSPSNPLVPPPGYGYSPPAPLDALGGPLGNGGFLQKRLIPRGE